MIPGTVIALNVEKTRRLIGTKTEYCPICDKPLSFRDDKPFCRKSRCAFNRVFERAHMRNRNHEEALETRRY